MVKHFCLMMCLLISVPTQAMSVNDYLSHVSNNHPEIRAIEAITGQFESDILYAKGEFDTRLEQSIFSRASGYYDGLQARQRITKPIETFGAEVFTEYRISEGEFPVYENEYETLSAGEVSVGIKLSLLKGRDTDQDRTAMISAQLNYQKWLQEARLAQSEFYYSALSHYLDWVEAVNYRNKYKQLVDITRGRKKAIGFKVDEGELAKLALLEVDTRLLERESALLSADRKVTAAQQKLLYFLSDDSEQPMSSLRVDTEKLLVSWPSLFLTNLSTEISEEHPVLMAQALKMKDLIQYQQLAETELLPVLDFEAKLAHDIGSGSRSLEQTDTLLGLNFSLPLNQTQARAKRTKLNYEISELKSKTDALKRSISNKLAEQSVNLSFAKQENDIQRKQVDLARRLFKQEQRQFELAASDFFMLNNREEEAFHSELKALTTEINILREELMLLKLNGRLDQQFIKAIF